MIIFVNENVRCACMHTQRRDINMANSGRRDMEARHQPRKAMNFVRPRSAHDCPTCGQTFFQGYHYSSHVATCDGRVEEDDVSQDSLEAGGDGGDISPHDSPQESSSSDDNAIPPPANSIESHMTTLDDRGTLDIKHVLQYHGWGTVNIDPQTREVMRFLRSVESGGGQSNGATKTTLDYVRSAGGRAAILPMTVATSWKRVAQVMI